MDFQGARYRCGRKELPFGLRGLKAPAPAFLWGGDCVLIHDGARPFVDEPMIERIVSDIRSYSAAGMPSKDTSSWWMRTDLPL